MALSYDLQIHSGMANETGGLGLDSDFFEYNDPPRREEIVATSAMRSLKQRLALDYSDRTKGRIRLVIGRRGSGKSTCLEYVQGLVRKEFPSSSFIQVDAGAFKSKLTKLPAPEAYEFFLEQLALEISGGKETDVYAVSKTLEAAKQKHFLLIDNLDRVYSTDDSDLELVKRLLMDSDPGLKRLSKSMVIVITAAPEWEDILRTGDLSYLNYEGRVILEPMTQDELADAVKARLDSRDRELTELFDESFLSAMILAAGGIPRFIFQRMERYNATDMPSPPLQLHHLLPEHGEEVESGIIENLHIAASETIPDPKTGGKINLAGAIGNLRTYVEMVRESNPADLEAALSQLEKAYEGPMKSDEIRFRSAWGSVAHEGARHKWELHARVQGILGRWHARTKVPLQYLLATLPAASLEGEMVGLAEYDQKYRHALRQDAQTLQDYENAHNTYLRLHSEPIAGLSTSEVITQGWTCVEGVMIAIHFLSGLTPDPTDLRSRLHGSGTFKRASEELIDGIDRAYSVAGVGFNAFSEDLAQLSNYKAKAFDQPEKLRLYSPSQMEALRDSALRTFEGLVRQLTPSKLRTARQADLPQIQSLIHQEEDLHTEFKAAFRYNPKIPLERNPDRNLERRVMESICALSNTDGGMILLGVYKQDGRSKIVGIEGDMSLLKKPSTDEFELLLRQRMDDWLPESYGIVRVEFRNSPQGTIAILRVKASNQRDMELATKDKHGSNMMEYWIRDGNRNKKLSVDLKKRWQAQGPFDVGAEGISD